MLLAGAAIAAAFQPRVQCHRHSVTAAVTCVAAPGGKSSVGQNTAQAGNKNAGPTPKTVSNFPVGAAFQASSNKWLRSMLLQDKGAFLSLCWPQS